ncbi:AzlC family ABC transporter permease [Kaustia mangrovi]|uniref:AzlC family ABC transporter permease n=1 Tax=Kaustia mangrovi TaxID=2593653 RepID=A0A7S8C1Y4_9HYPH|nr:AzlC family ABC transporter permease [Kaustia mangrovi]QPC41888.1 AzlC family ABC transporter permease [Kaustia mangrovi]
MRESWASEFTRGVATILPVAMAVTPFALIFGALAAQKGLSPLEVGLMSGLVFAGASQFVAVDIWQHPAPWLVLGFTALTINLRHVMMGASIARHMGRFSAASRYVSLYFLADEIWALAERRASVTTLTPGYFLGLGVTLYLGWIGLTVSGALAGSALGDPERFGFDFVFTAIFIALIVGFWRGYRTGVIVAASAAVAALTHLLVPGPWYILAGGLAGIATGAAFMAEDVEEQAA